ncbi:SsgA family sporulation/cell division regulator [Nocardioides sp. AE5]|uniref:SsgA family sporulation/cell division regulator n=1 Tax=Nocardioides sp. AE5 TaxID=2962573 RepID=UPI002882B6B5|nr:SsgA family sporulation/cell division regulator [Nocardioides sp. AE5]MDT0203376.1 SsgA family sporulation/cell division regulator [Nocardioides sp. AE5]
MLNEEMRGRTDIRHEMDLVCVDGEGRSMRLGTTFGYSAADPFAVTLTFRTHWCEVVWTFARDLLILGTTEPTGDGDVHVRPSLDRAGNATVVLEFSSPDGNLVAEASAAEITAFLASALSQVPAGTESRHIDVDELIGHLLTH